MWYLKIFLKTNVRQWNIVCLFLFRKKAKIVFSSLLPVISKIDNCQILMSFSVATHSSVLAWRVPGTGEPGGLPSVGSHGVGHDWSDLAAVVAAMSFSHGYIFPFLLCFSLPFFSQLFIRPPQTAILLFCKMYIHTKSCTWISIALFIIAPKYKQPNCPPVDKRINKMCYLYTMEFYSVRERSEVLIPATTGMNLENFLKEARHRDHTYIKCPEQANL